MSKPGPSGGDIAIVGMACRFPHAPDLQSFWRVIRTGEVCFDAVPKDRWNHAAFYDPQDSRHPDKAYINKGAFIDGVKDFAALHYGLAPRRVQVMDPQQRLVVDAVRVALQDAGYERRAFDRSRTGVFVGASSSEYRDVVGMRVRAMQLFDGAYGEAPLGPQAEELAKRLVEDVVPMRAFTLPGQLLNMIPATVSQVFDLSGPSFTIDAACSSALVAVHEAAVNLHAGECDVALAGGVYLNIGPDNLIAFSRIGAISKQGQCRPFDSRADGFVMGEGVGMVVLKRAADARRDGDRIYALIKGSGCNNDGRGDGPMTPRAVGQIDAMARAHAGCEVPVSTLGFVETHGTATTVGDQVEVGALKDFFAQRGAADGQFCYLSSVKANIGHTMSAAGVAGLIKAALIVHHRTFAPQPGCEELNPKLDLERSPFKITRAATAWEAPRGHPRRGAVSSFGFGGTNAHVVLEEVEALDSGAEERDAPELFVLSAASPALVARYAGSLAAALRADPAPSNAEVAFTLAGRALQDSRLAIVARGREELLVRLDAAQKALQSTGAPLAKLATGVYFAAAPLPEAERKVAFLFPGQGAQRVDLAKDLYDRFPRFRARLAELDPAAVAALYPDRAAPGFDLEQATRALTQTRVCQPAMAALGLSLAELLEAAGVMPAVVLGHSLGEFAAAAHAGVLSAGEAVRLVARRGEAMSALPLADPGTMLAAMGGREAVTAAVQGIPGVWLANFNHPTQVVLSGTQAGIDAAAAALDQAQVKTTALKVSHAFHSPLLAAIDAQVAEWVEPLPLGEARFPVVSCISGRPYASAADAKQIWARHATAPVEFQRALEAAAQTGARIFVQVGAGNSLLAFARGTVAHTGHHFLSAGAAEPDDGVTLCSALAQLAVLGVPVDARGLHQGRGLEVVSLPATPLETQSYWAIERTASRENRAPVALGVTKGGGSMDDLVNLFQGQMALLQTQVDILKKQAEALASVAPSARASAPTAWSPPAAVGPQPAAAPVRPVAPAAPAVAVDTSGVADRVFQAVARISAFPKETIKRDQALIAELGFDSLMLVELDGDIAKAWPQVGGFPKEMLARETTAGQIVDYVAGRLGGTSSLAPAAAPTALPEPVVAAPSQAAPLPAPVASEPVRVYQVALAEQPLRALSEHTPTLPERVLIIRDSLGVAEKLQVLLRRAGFDVDVAEGRGDFPVGGIISLAGLGAGPQDWHEPLRTALRLARRVQGKNGCFVWVTGLGGRFQAGPEGLGWVGGAGFTKALGREWPDAMVKAIDVDPAIDPQAIAERLRDELISGDRSPEVGFADGKRWAFALAPVAAGEPPALTREDVVLVTGGARGLGARFATELAARFGCTLALIGRAAAGPQSAAAIQSIQAAGGKGSYHSADVRDGRAVARVAQEIRERYGRIDGFVHAAGIIADAPLAQKDDAKFASVVDTKAGGAFHLVDVTARDRLKLAAFVSSWSGRFGNAGQVDYAAANELVNRLASTLARNRPEVRSVAIAFPPFESSAMAKQIPAFARRELAAQGVTFLADTQGAAAFIEALGAPSGELLIGAEIPRLASTHRASLLISRAAQPYLEDHQMGGQPVLPLAAALDHAATAAAASLGLGEAFTVTDFRLHKGIFVPDQAWLEVAVREQDGLASLELSSATSPQAPRAVAYRGTLRAANEVTLPEEVVHPAAAALPLTLDAFYGSFSLHGPRLRAIQQIDGISTRGISGWVKTSRPGDWVLNPTRSAWTVDPLAVDGSFQLAAYWAWVTRQRAGFPLGFAEYTQLAAFGEGPVRCSLTLEATAGERYRGTITYHSADGRLLALMTGVEADFNQTDPLFGRAAVVQTASSPSSPRVNGTAKNGHPGVNGHAISVAAEPEAPAPAPGSIDESTYLPEKFPEYLELKKRLTTARLSGLKNPFFNLHEKVTNDTSVIGGKKYINYSSYNYVGMSGDPAVTRASKEAVERYGTSVSASRIASGEKPLHRELEEAISRFVGTEASIVFVGGYVTNVTVVGHIVGKGDLILHDALAHDSVLQGAKLSGATRRPFPHNDWAALDKLLASLRGHYRRVLIVVEGVYSMDGDIADLPRFIELKKKYKALLLVDEAHSLGVLGRTGRGVGEYFDVDRRDVDLWMGTLSKSLASCGGYIAGSKELVEYLKYTAPGFVYSVGISPSNAAASLEAIRQLEAHPERVARLRQRSAYFLKLAKEAGIDTGLSHDSAVIPCIVGNSVRCLQLSEGLWKRGINVQPILYPAVEENMARLRFFLTSTHTEEQIRYTVEAIAKELGHVSLRQRLTLAAAEMVGPNNGASGKGARTLLERLPGGTAAAAVAERLRRLPRPFRRG